MPAAGWWPVQTASAMALLACALLAFASSGRVGRHTPYGNLLFVIASGFWFLLCGLAYYLVTVAADAWDGPPGLGDAFTLTGWSLLAFAFVLLLFQYPNPRRTGGRPRHHILVPLATGVLFGGFSLYWSLFDPLTGTLEDVVRSAYLFVDGVIVAVFLLSIDALRRLRRASLGRLYLALGIALVIKTIADLLFLVWPRINPLGLFATALYPLAGLVAVVGLVVHYAAVRPLSERRALSDPSLIEEQLVLRDAAWRLRGIAGEMGERLVLTAGARSLESNGIRCHVVNGAILATASAPAWRRAVRAAKDRAVAVLGEPAAAAFRAVLETYDYDPSEVAA
ncbi:MAG: hypothetical protein KY455_06250 [Euryarchaeota archaeon]|nr:hypothetical protein [Euryarchaeota archaeon]